MGRPGGHRRTGGTGAPGWVRGRRQGASTIDRPQRARHAQGAATDPQCTTRGASCQRQSIGGWGDGGYRDQLDGRHRGTAGGTSRADAGKPVLRGRWRHDRCDRIRRHRSCGQGSARIRAGPRADRRVPLRSDGDLLPGGSRVGRRIRRERHHARILT